MEDKRTALAVLICIIVVVVYTQLVIEPQARRYRGQKPSAPIAAQTNPASAVAPTAGAAPVVAPGVVNPIIASEPSLPSLAALNSSGETVIETQNATIRVAHLGARISSYKLKSYQRTLEDKQPLDMIAAKDGAALPLGVYFGATSDANVQYSLAAAPQGATRNGDSYTLPNEGEFSFRFVGKLTNGSVISKTLLLRGGSYLFDADVSVSPAPADNAPLWLEWTHTFNKDEKASSIAPGFIMLAKETGKVEHVYLYQHKQEGLTEAGDKTWLSFSDKYFMATLIPTARGANSKYGAIGDIAVVRSRGEASQGKFSLYVGPKDDRVLNQVGFELQRNIDLGWFSFLAWPLLKLIRFFYHLLGNFGLAIILLTLSIKLAFLPLTKASFDSMKGLQEIQPEMKALRERIKDPNQLNQEIMALYKKKGVNPMGGCFPMLIQIPVFLGLYNSLLNSIELRHAPFALWINDLSAPESLHIMGIGVPIMVLLMGLSMFVQQYFTPSSGDPAQRRMMYIMTAVFTFIFIQGAFPAGLVLYWLTNNIISITQQAFLRGQSKVSPFVATLVASVGIFAFGYILTIV